MITLTSCWTAFLNLKNLEKAPQQLIVRILKQGFDHLYQIFGHLYKFLDSLEFIEGSAIVGDWCVEASVRLPVPFHRSQFSNHPPSPTMVVGFKFDCSS